MGRSLTSWPADALAVSGSIAASAASAASAAGTLAAIQPSAFAGWLDLPFPVPFG